MHEPIKRQPASERERHDENLSLIRLMGRYSVLPLRIGAGDARPAVASDLIGAGEIHSRTRQILARPEGFEPPTPRSVVWCSVQLSYGRESVIVLVARARELQSFPHEHESRTRDTKLVAEREGFEPSVPF